MADSHTAIIVGAGAVGGYLGAGLATASPPWRVTLVGRSAGVQTIQRDGLRIGGIDRDLHVFPAITSTTDGIEPAPLVVLAVRSDDVAAAIDSLRSLLTRDGIVLAIQNGLGTDDLLVDALGRERVVSGALTTSVMVTAPGTIERTSQANGIALAASPGGPPLDWLTAAFRSTGLDVTVVTDPRALRWSKLLLNMIGAPTSAILDVSIDHIVTDPRLFRIEQLAFREATRVMDALGVRPVDLPGYPVRLARLAMRLPLPLAQRVLAPRIVAARSGRSPGMRADMRRNRSEIGSFHGAVTRAGAQVGVPTPVCGALTALTLELVADPPRRAPFRGRPEMLLDWLAGRAIDV